MPKLATESPRAVVAERRRDGMESESKKREVLQLLKDYRSWHSAFGGAVAPATTSKTDIRSRKAMLSLAVAAVVAATLMVLASHPASAAVSTVQDTDRDFTQYGNWMFTREPGASAILKFKGTQAP